MSAPAPARLTGGYSQIPNSLIENQAVFTHAELALALIVLRRGGTREPVTVSDRNWQSWTRLHPRSKELAMAGLRKKCLTMEGRGDRAKIRFDRSAWEAYVIARPESKARTEGRRAVDPKPGAKVHPQCRDRGCALLPPSGEAQTELTLLPASPNAQPVARINHLVPPGAGFGTVSGDPRLSLLAVTPNAKHVSHSAGQVQPDPAEQVWAKALGMLRQFFPLVGLAFLVRLVAFCRALFPDVQDAELATAIQTAYRHKGRLQRGEGLFLHTVPEALAELRRRPPPTASPQHADFEAGVRLLLDRVADSLRARGAPFAPALSRVESIRQFKEGADLVHIDGEMESIEVAIVETARQILTDDERAIVDQGIKHGVESYPAGRMTDRQRATLRRQIEDREVLTILGIPRLSLLYA